MKLEYLPDGSPDCPLIRLYDFRPDEAMRLKAIFDALADGTQTAVALHLQPGIVPVGGCQLILRRDATGIGIREKSHQSFECGLTPDSWSDAASLTEPFCRTELENHHQWLNEDGPISLLLSPDGKW